VPALLFGADLNKLGAEDDGRDDLFISCFLPLLFKTNPNKE